MARKIIVEDGADVTPSDTTNLSIHGTLYIGTGGNIKVLTTKGTTLTYYNVPDGTFLPVVVKKVFSTNTTADNIIVNY